MSRRSVLGLLVAMSLGLAGCGTKPVPVKGVVTLDGQPVEGASVTFVSGDGNQSYSGFTDATGTFTLDAGQNKAISPGTYKVLVVKTPKADVPQMEPGSPDAMKMMQKETKDTTKINKGLMPNPAMIAGKGHKINSELPIVYANFNTTPLSAKVPPDTQPVPIELKSKP